MRIVWLCSFSNADKRAHLHLWRDRGGETGPWIPNLLQGLRFEKDMEIHVVTLEPWMKREYETWRDGNIVYHVLRPLFPPFGYNFRIPIDEFTDFRSNRNRLCALIERIAPDIVHLFGAENPRYASATLDLPKSIPIVCTIQGFVFRELPFNRSYTNRVRTVYEKRIIQHINYYFVEYDSEKVVRHFNPVADCNYLYFPVNDRLVNATRQQTICYDALFAGALSRAKGFGDFLKIVVECVKRNPSFKAAVVGSIDSYPDARFVVREHRLEDVIDWIGRFPTQEGLFAAYRKSRLFLAPTYNDAFPSTIRENMLLGTPCIAYKTGGIPYANNDGNENVVIVDQGDWNAMAEKVLFYVSHEAERKALASRAKAYAEKTFSLNVNVGVIKQTYEKMIKEE